MVIGDEQNPWTGDLVLDQPRNNRVLNTALAVEYMKKTLIIKQASEDSGSLSIHMYPLVI